MGIAGFVVVGIDVDSFAGIEVVVQQVVIGIDCIDNFGELVDNYVALVVIDTAAVVGIDLELVALVTSLLDEIDNFESNESNADKGQVVADKLVEVDVVVGVPVLDNSAAFEVDNSVVFEVDTAAGKVA